MVEAIPAEAFTNPAQPMPWGSPVDEDRNCPESVGHGTYEFGAGMAEGAGMLLLGYNPETGDFWDGSSYGQAWGGLGNLVGSFALMSTVGGIVAAGMAVTGHTDNEFFAYMGERSEVVVGGLGALVGYDINAEDGWHKWKEDGVAAGTGAVLSIGTFFIPGVGEVGAGLKAGSMGAKVARIAAVTADVAVQGGGWLVKGGLRVATGLRDVLRFGDDVLPTAERAGQAGAVARISPTALIASMDDLPEVHVTPPKPVSDELFGPSPVEPRGTTELDAPAERPDSPSEHLDPPSEHLDPPAEHFDPAHPDRGPVWTGDTLPNGRPDVSAVPQAQWNDPRYDPSSFQYDATPRGEHGYVGTVNPDVLSPSTLTHSGLLIDPNVVPPRLQPFIDTGVIINDDGVLRLSQPVEVTFSTKNPNIDPAEFLRQGDLQERSLNQQSVAGWQENMDHFDLYKRVDGPVPTNYRVEQIQLRADALEARTGMTPDAALAQAEQEAAGLHVLHGPDQVAGGNPLQLTGLGDARVNGAYGRGWGQGGQRLRLRGALESALDAYGIPDDLLGDIRMNVNIKVLVMRP